MRASCLALALVLACSCSSSGGSRADVAVGGDAPDTADAPAATGGSPASGGTFGAGGIVGTGGLVATGGVVGTGGTTMDASQTDSAPAGTTDVWTPLKLPNYASGDYYQSLVVDSTARRTHSPFDTRLRCAAFLMRESSASGTRT